MKKIILTGIALGLALTVGTSSISAKKYGMAGCGLGAMLKTDHNNGQMLALSLNSIYGNQSFGITSGTSNCTPDGIVKKDKEQEVFVHMNYDSLEKEMATGKGEKLDSLATLFGCDKAEFSKFAKNNYGKFFSGNEDPSIFLSSLKAEVAKDAKLKSSCQL